MRTHTKNSIALDFEDPMHESIDDRNWRQLQVEDGILEPWEALFMDGVEEADYDEEEVES